MATFALERPSGILITHDKALRINLDQRRYGTFAEIGAGQEVVRWFFRVGGASGTIAKSISAYDMTVSDTYYGKCKRYVCQQRLQSMLDHEYEQTVSQLREARGDTTAFFAFADTVSARNFQGTNECHGWMGIRFQTHPRDQESQLIIHVRMLDSDNSLQQEALGVVGVNLLYGVCFLHHEPEQLLESLLDNLSIQRLEIDMIEFSGIAFRHVDNRVMSLKLVQLGLSNAAMFAADGTMLQPSEVLYKKAILVERGSFRPVTHVNVDMLRSGYEKFSQEPGVRGEDVVQLTEITMNNLLNGGLLDYRDFLARIDLLAAVGMTVMISNYFEYYRLAAYLSRYTKKRIGITMGAASLRDLFDEKWYTHLEGGILESFGRLFKNDLKLYIYPLLDPATGDLTAVQNLEVAPDLRKLYEYLVERGRIEQLSNFTDKYLPIFSRDVLQKIRDSDLAWEDMVPPEVSEGAKRCERPHQHRTATMLAVRIHSYGDPTGVKIGQAPRPEPGRGQVLVRVKATGVNPLDWMVAEGKARSWIDHRLPLTLGWELAGIVEKLGADVTWLKPGDEVFGMIDLASDGADAEFAVGDENAFAIKPRTLDFPHAAAVPIGAMTAHQALFDAAELRAGQTVLIHAAAGGVGSMAVQLAKAQGARVFGTASGAEHIELIRKLGCDEAIDYKATRFEDHVRDVDVVLDPIGGDSQRRSFGVLKKGGILVALREEPRQDLARQNGVRVTMIGVKPDGRRLADIGKIIDDGKLRPLVQAVLPLAQAKTALQLSYGQHAAGKIVLTT